MRIKSEVNYLNVFEGDNLHPGTMQRGDWLLSFMGSAVIR